MDRFERAHIIVWDRYRVAVMTVSCNELEIILPWGRYRLWADRILTSTGNNFGSDTIIVSLKVKGRVNASTRLCLLLRVVRKRTWEKLKQPRCQR